MFTTTANGIPVSGFGLYALGPDIAIRAVSSALEAGYRHIDTAQSYGNEAACGEAIAGSGLPREEVFVTTKVTPRNLAPGRMLPSVRESCENLRLDMIDLVLIHYPYPWDLIPMETYLEQLGELHEAGVARMVGVSNFTIAQMDLAEKMLGKGGVATNQVEIHVFHQNRPVVEHCRRLGIPATAYCALARGNLFGSPKERLGPHPTLVEIAAKHSATVAQIGLSFLLHEGHVTLSTTIDTDQISSNLKARELALDDEDMYRLRAMDMRKRIVDTPYFPIFD